MPLLCQDVNGTHFYTTSNFFTVDFLFLYTDIAYFYFTTFNSILQIFQKFWKTFNEVKL